MLGTPTMAAVDARAQTASFSLLARLLVAEGWRVGLGRVFRLWRREGLAPIAEPRSLTHQLQHPSDQRRFITPQLWRVALTRTWLIQHLTGPSLGDRELRLQLANCHASPGRAHQFPEATCFSI